MKVPGGVHPATDPVRVVRAWDRTRRHRWPSAAPSEPMGELRPGGMAHAAVNERVGGAPGRPLAGVRRTTTMMGSTTPDVEPELPSRWLSDKKPR